MKTFANYPGGRAAAIAAAQAHYDQDRLIRGEFYKNGSDDWAGCSVGCFVRTERNPHKAFSTLFGVPEWFSHLVDHIFEELSTRESKEWHLQWINALPCGVDISPIGPAHAARCLRRCVAYIDGGQKDDWPEHHRATVEKRAEVLEAVRWMNKEEAAWTAWAEEAARAAWAKEAAWDAETAWGAWAAEVKTQRDDLLDLLKEIDEVG